MMPQLHYEMQQKTAQHSTQYFPAELSVSCQPDTVFFLGTASTNPDQPRRLESHDHWVDCETETGQGTRPARRTIAEFR
ncbi:hypothetical protein CEP54_001911 [Fusarium duplospermum]|uniref:Uncharacterized protein n=1 Tax=Fusarium duplospermum TaxID=1325734 RepID=A0A428QY39_9HYPO|nr:hypothetical protein CEP54_001911 [Fusarium duplospermum]